MAYNLKLVDRIRSQLKGIPVVEKKMFGGVGFLVNGNMACGVHKDDLIVRVDPEKHTALLKKPNVRPFDMTGRPMKGWLIVDLDGIRSDKQLNRWIEQGIDFALTLPAK